ncbi:helix-turn-helix domain-containing protein [Hyphomonas sp. CACIAM 19H1]|uniref:helix-turn-helix domain-containing protein n=1 Tax=Hyphomonas sp. CACIAM 19H1 TaxID=1873716 RepID=UPI000DEDA2BD|nr:helix-turn-helix transcriptional regulator [Hyphomonas sp. CACIAM 19H1]
MGQSKKTASASRAPTEVDRVVGENVRQARTRRGRTQMEVAADLGISHQQLQKYETGSNRLSAGMIDRVATVLGVSIASLFTRPKQSTGQSGPGKAARRLDALREEAGWLLARTESETDLKMMVAVLRAMSAKS